MDEVTRAALMRRVAQNPGCAIKLTHKFLSGTDANECGYVPNDWDGISTKVFIPDDSWFGWSYLNPTEDTDDSDG